MIFLATQIIEVLIHADSMKEATEKISKQGIVTFPDSDEFELIHINSEVSKIDDIVAEDDLDDDPNNSIRRIK